MQDKFGADLTNFGGQPAVDIDIFFDTSGATSIIPEVARIAKNNSRLVIIALYHNMVTINPLDIVYSELEALGSFAYNNDDIRECIQALKDKSAKVEKIITHHFPLEKINDAFKQAAKADCTLKVLIDHEI